MTQRTKVASAQGRKKKADIEKADLTHRQDLSIAVMNLISLEEHLAFTAMKTKRKHYLEILAAVRKLRIKMLGELVHNREGELWCISKHLLAATMRLMEVATKYIGKSNDTAYEFERAAFDLYGLFWLLQSLDEKVSSEV
ncbi:MAG: hypothetical protein QXU88_02600 [Candidatus Woesearchaeota archaeon]